MKFTPWRRHHTPEAILDIPGCICSPSPQQGCSCTVANLSTACRPGCKLLQAYVDREVDQETASAIRQHVQNCPRCRKEVDVDHLLRATLHQQVTVPQPALDRLRDFATRYPDETQPGTPATREDE